MTDTEVFQNLSAMLGNLDSTLSRMIPILDAIPDRLADHERLHSRTAEILDRILRQLNDNKPNLRIKSK